MLEPAESYEAMMRDFVWRIPERYNIAYEVCDRWALREPERTCLHYFEPDGRHRSMRYGTLARRSSAFARSLAAKGITKGDRVALLLPQSFETVVAHVAIYRLGAIAVPLALLFGPDALDYRLLVSGARAVVTNAMGLEKLAEIADRRAALSCCVSIDGADRHAFGFETMCDADDTLLEPVATTAATPALMIFTSGTTGAPKGALHGHGVLAGHMPGIQYTHAFLPQPGDRMWTPADWAWAGGLLNALLPALALGVPVVASKAQKFDAETACRILAEMEVRNAFLPPTALRLLATVEAPRERFAIDLRTLSSAGEPLGTETATWAERALGVPVNELYGQTECNAVIGSCAQNGAARRGSTGLPLPGHRVALLDADGTPVGPGMRGEIAIAGPDPVMFLGYWRDAAATEAKFCGDWMLTGDHAIADTEGYITFIGREDDIITSSGFRIGPAEIENCLEGHRAVALAAVVGKPDPVRTEIVKAYVVLRPGEAGTPALAADLSAHVRAKLSAHEYPREIAFVESLPMTTTGKIIRRELRERAAREIEAADAS
ncbi:AMP-binding protein [Pararhizobium mangrovi]|uniref:AMP-binding protein n=1 Tax=Pararhizobium mangrovi TaxID=2590452 RepID=A0A506TX21_9HYPH|nr:AMP-binding protein [Pararhizobium mangrovi]TPW26060.1 AMP-binding protein [Pararhizobium mangrovi]